MGMCIPILCCSKKKQTYPILMLKSILRACIVPDMHLHPLYLKNTISMVDMQQLLVALNAERLRFKPLSSY